MFFRSLMIFWPNRLLRSTLVSSIWDECLNWSEHASCSFSKDPARIFGMNVWTNMTAGIINVYIKVLSVAHGIIWISTGFGDRCSLAKSVPFLYHKRGFPGFSSFLVQFTSKGACLLREKIQNGRNITDELFSSTTHTSSLPGMWRPLRYWQNRRSSPSAGRLEYRGLGKYANRHNAIRASGDLYGLWAYDASCSAVAYTFGRDPKAPG